MSQADPLKPLFLIKEKGGRRQREELKAIWGETESEMLTLDVDRDTGLLAVGDCLVGGLTDDLLTRLDVGRRQVERAHGALSSAIPEQGLQREEQSEVELHRIQQCW